MYQETTRYFETLASKKLQYFQQHRLAFIVQSMLAGSYVGFGIILIFSVAGLLDPSIQKLVMGVSFGIALSLVVFAGAELFTGYIMYFTSRRLRGKLPLIDIIKIWFVVWISNFVGALLLCVLYFAGKGLLLNGPSSELLMQVAAYKMNSGAIELLARGILCNWLVCLALWMAARVDSDTAKAIVIFWALFAFISSGFEHSVANMTLLSLALIGDHPTSVTLLGLAHNLLWVSIGNILGGGLFVSFAYHLGSTKDQSVKTSRTNDYANSISQKPDHIS